MRKGMLLVFLVFSVLILSVSAIVIHFEWPIQSGVQVLADELVVYEADGITECHNIDFGSLRQGESTDHDIVVENTGDYYANLGLESDLWDEYGTVTWNYSGALLLVDEIMPLRLTLTLNGTSPRGTYDFTITINTWTSG